MSAPAVSRVMGGVTERNKNIGEMIFGGRFFVNVVSLKYIGKFGMVYINVSEMCFIPMNVHNELFNGILIYNSVLKCQHDILKSGASTPRTVTKFAVKTAIDLTSTI